MNRTQSIPFVSLPRRAGGFTLVEVMLVVVIIGMIVGIALPQISKNTEKSRIGTAKAEIRVLDGAVLQFEMDTGQFPSSLNGLVSNPGVNGWDGPYLKNGKLPKDPWGNDYQFSVSGDGYEIKSGGRGGQNPLSSND